MAGKFGNRYFSLNQLNTSALVNWPWMNQKIWSVGGFLSRITPAVIEDNLEKRIKADIDLYVGDCYKESNQKTSELIGIDLSLYNYNC